LGEGILREEKLFLNIEYLFSSFCNGLKYCFLGTLSSVFGALLFFGLFTESGTEEFELESFLPGTMIKEKLHAVLNSSKRDTKVLIKKEVPLETALMKEEKPYNFGLIRNTFGGINISRVNELSKREFEDIVLSSVPTHLRGKLKPFLKTTLFFSEKYQVDPFWVLAVMWTESHFNPNARSYVNARGLMQIMPRTGYFLAGLLNKPVKNVKTAVKMAKKPIPNIEMGAFYLKKILVDFNQNYTFATAAYNMGPGGVKRRLRRGLPVGNRNKYLNKVKRAYVALIRGYKRNVLSLSSDYMETFVVRRKSFRPSKGAFLLDNSFWNITLLPYKKEGPKKVFLASLMGRKRDSFFL